MYKEHYIDYYKKEECSEYDTMHIRRQIFYLITYREYLLFPPPPTCLNTPNLEIITTIKVCLKHQTILKYEYNNLVPS